MQNKIQKRNWLISLFALLGLIALFFQQAMAQDALGDLLPELSWQRQFPTRCKWNRQRKATTEGDSEAPTGRCRVLEDCSLGTEKHIPYDAPLIQERVS